jgi:dipeptidase E
LNLSKPLLYIPIATNTTKYPYSGCVDWLSGVLGPLGVANIIMWTEEDLKTKTENDFEQFSGVYIGGGNTFKLLKELKEFGTFENIRKLALKGIPIYGGSAGAIILAKTIIPAMSADENKVGLTDFSALNLVHGFDVWCHYTSSEDEIIRKYMTEYDLKKVIAIPETAGLYVTEESIEAVGPANVKVFGVDNREARPGDKITF